MERKVESVPEHHSAIAQTARKAIAEFGVISGIPQRLVWKLWNGLFCSVTSVSPVGCTDKPILEFDRTLNLGVSITREEVASEDR